jgi:hypothetical protein
MEQSGQGPILLPEEMRNCLWGIPRVPSSEFRPGAGDAVVGEGAARAQGRVGVEIEVPVETSGVDDTRG